MLDNTFKIIPVLKQEPCLVERVSDLTHIKEGTLLEINRESYRVYDIKVTDYKDLANPKYEITVLSRDKETISKRTYIDTDAISLRLGLLHYPPGRIPINKGHFRTLKKDDREYKIFDRFLKEYELQQIQNQKLNIFVRLFKKLA